MAEKDKRLIALGRGGGNSGDPVWGSITGTLSDQTDLKDALDSKASASDIPTATSDLENDSGYITLNDVPAQVQSDWNQSDNTQVDFIKNKPTIPAAQIQSDWNQSNNQSVDYIKNKPTIDVTAAGDNTFTGDNIFTKDTLIGDLSDISLNLTVNTYGMPQIEGSDANTYKGFYINTDGIVFNDSNLGDDTGLGITLDSSTGDVTVYAGFGGIDLQAPTVSVYGNPVATTDILATVATTGDYDDLTNKPTIPAAQVSSDWNAVSGVAQILNKPSMSTETLTFVDANNVSTTVVVYTQPQV